MGIKSEGKTSYPGYVPPSRAGGSVTPTTTAPSGAQNSTRPSDKVVPASTKSPSSSAGKLTTTGYAQTAYTPSNAVALAGRNAGFRKLNERTYRDPSTACVG